METTNERRFRKDHILFDWFRIVRNKNIPISESVLKEKTLKVEKDLDGCLEFLVSNTYICRETEQLNKEEASEWKNKLKGLIEQYAPKNIFNLDETALFFRALPTKNFS
jgi:hypothetical protein